MGIGSSGVVNCANTYLGTANYTVADGYVADRTVIVDGNGPAQLNLDFARNEVLDPRITFSRTSNATRVNAQGLVEYAPHNLLTYSQEFDNAIWVKGTGVTVTPNTTIAPDGTTTADLIASPQDQGCYENLLSVGAGITVTNSIYIKAGTATQLLFRDDLGAGRHIVINPITGQIVGSSGTILASGSISMGNGWYRYYMTYVTDSVNARNWIRNDTAGTLTYYTWGAQFNIGSLQPYYTTSVKNLLGYSQNFENAAWTKSNSSVLTNLLTYSQEFDNAVWTKVGSSLTANVITAPDGTTTADKFIDDGSIVGQGYISQNYTYTASPYVFSFYAKAGEVTSVRCYLVDSIGIISASNAMIDLTSGAVTSGSAVVTNAGSGWYRIAVTGVPTAGAGSVRILQPTDTSTTNGFYIWGAQLVQGTNPEEYTVTTSAPAPIQVMGPLGFLGAEKLVEDTANITHFIQQNVTVAAGIPYTLSLYAKESQTSPKRYLTLLLPSAQFDSNKRATFDLATGTLTAVNNPTTATMTNVGNGWWRCEISATATVSGATGIGIRLFNAATDTLSVYQGDGTSGIYVFGAQLSDSASLDPYTYNFGAAPTSTAYYGPRFDYDPVTLAPKGLLIEEQRTNLIIASENLSAVTWTKTGVPVLDAAIQDPSGNINTVYYPTVSEIYQIFDGAGVGTISLSFFGKKREGSSNNQIVIQIFQQVAATVVDLGSYWFSLVTTNPDSTYFKNIKREQYQNGWYRFSCQIVANTGAGTGNFSASSRIDIEGGSAQNYVWGIQIELNAFPTSYIPTTSAQVTRTADNASMTGTNFSSWYNQSEGTVSSSFDVNGVGSSTNYNGIVCLDDGSINNAIELSMWDASGDSLRWVGYVANTPQWVISPKTYSSGVSNGAGGYQINNFNAAFDGILGTTDNSGSIPTVNIMRIGTNRGGNSNYLNGHIKSIKYFNKRLLNSYLQSLTQ